jgi:putative SOS response-associated peptidase YedK
MCIQLRGQEPFVFAGLWDTWKKPDDAGDAEDAEIESYTIITCEPNDLMRSIHNRMPVILKPENYDQWLDPKNEDVDGLAKLLAPYPEKEMGAHPVSTLVNNPKFDDPRCIEPVE